MSYLLCQRQDIYLTANEASTARLTEQDVLLTNPLDNNAEVAGLAATVYLVLSYINAYTPIYTNILYQILPMSVWTIIGVGQYLFPLIVLLKIKVPPKIWFYYLLYPLFVYSWIPVNILGWFRRHNKVWSHTVHTRAVGLDDVKLTRMGNMNKNQK